MAESIRYKITSTPLDTSHLERTSLTYSSDDSGYNSANLSSSIFESNGPLQTSSSSDQPSCTSHKLEPIKEQTQHEVFTEKRRFHRPASIPTSRLWTTQISPKIQLQGREFVDFMYYFGERNKFPLLLSKILSYLGDEDLHNSAAVSKTWRRTVLSTPNAEKRLKLYRKRKEFTKENRSISQDLCPGSDELRVSSMQTPRFRLMQIQNTEHSRLSGSSGESSHSSHTTYRFEAYQREVQKLKFGERLFSCPKCKLPSRIDPKILVTAECTNEMCRYRFCVLCSCVEHLHKDCHFIATTPIPRKQNTRVCTKKSKKNLKRLLL